MLLAKSKIICPGFCPFEASFSIFLKLNQFHNFCKGASIFAVPHVLLSALPTGDVVASGAIQAW